MTRRQRIKEIKRNCKWGTNTHLPNNNWGKMGNDYFLSRDKINRAIISKERNSTITWMF